MMRKLFLTNITTRYTREPCKKNLVVFVLFVLLSMTAIGINPVHASTMTVHFGTGAYGTPAISAGQVDPWVTWNYTGDFSNPSYQAYVISNDTVNRIHTCNMGSGNCFQNTSYGADVPSGTPSYQGVAFYYSTFLLPLGATNIQLFMDSIGADNRMQVQLNGNILGYWGAGGTGKMDGCDIISGFSGCTQTTLTSVSFFVSYTNSQTLTNPALFNIGGQNVLRFWVNNTGSSNVGANSNPMSSGNPQTVRFRATLTYDPVPEPATLLLLGSGLLGFGFVRRRRNGAA